MYTFPRNHLEITELLNDFKELSAVSILLFSLFITLFVMPKIILISKKKNLTARPNSRTSHKGIVPTLGGIGVFTGLLLTVNIAATLFANYNQLIDLLIFNILVLLLLLTGVTDDIVTITPRKKLYIQVLIAFIFVFGTNVHINSFGGLFGLYNIPGIIAVGLSVFVIVLIINAYNLIDGIDGLAGVLGALISSFMALIFFFSDHFFYSLISLSLVGAMSGFLVYNFSRRRKIFLGDTGSMVVGFVLAYQVILYLNLSSNNSEMPMFRNAPVMVLTILSYPLFDTLRVFYIRIKNGNSPFMADRNHIHHRLLYLGLSHKYATILIALYTFFVSVLTFLLNDLSINTVFAIMLPLCVSLLLMPFIIKTKEVAADIGVSKVSEGVRS